MFYTGSEMEVYNRLFDKHDCLRSVIDLVIDSVALLEEMNWDAWPGTK